MGQQDAQDSRAREEKATSGLLSFSENTSAIDRTKQAMNVKPRTRLRMGLVSSLNFKL